MTKTRKVGEIVEIDGEVAMSLLFRATVIESDGHYFKVKLHNFNVVAWCHYSFF